MEYVYAAMLLHKAGQKITEEAVKKVLTAANVKVDDARVKALVAAMEGVDIKKAIETAAVAPVVAAPATPTGGAPAGQKKEEKKEEKKSDEQAAAGLGALFG